MKYVLLNCYLRVVFCRHCFVLYLLPSMFCYEPKGDEAWDSLALIGSESWNEGNYDEDRLLKEELFPNGYGDFTTLAINILLALHDKLPVNNCQV